MLFWCVFLNNLPDSCFLLWYGSCPILQEENWWDHSLLFFTFVIYSNIFYFTIIIICYCLPGVPKSDSHPAWRWRRFFISSVEDTVLERSAALESFCYGIGFGRLGRCPLFIMLYVYMLCNGGCSPT